MHTGVVSRLPFARAALLAVACLGLTGCPLLWLGAGVAGGYAISKDSVRNQFDLSKDVVFQRSLDVAKEMGFVTLEDRARGIIELKVQDANVKITVSQLTRKTVELRVRARNSLLMPEIDVAQAVYNKIIEKL
jgi:hypothetical protein